MKYTRASTDELVNPVENQLDKIDELNSEHLLSQRYNSSEVLSIEHKQWAYDPSPMCLWCEPLGVPGEHRDLPDVVQAQEEHDDSLHADTSPSVRGGTISE